MNDLVSVIILTWNRVEFLKEAVSSILNQTYKNFELLIIDNESTDETEDYVKGIGDKRIRYFKNQNNGILAINRNFGIRKAKGEYIAFCDDDDLWEPDKLRIQIELVNKHPEYKVVCTNGVYFDNNGDISYLIRRGKSGEITIDDLLKGKNDVIMSSSTFSREVYDNIGMYNVDPRIITIEDYEFLVRASSKFKIYYIKDCLVRYRIHGSMTSHESFIETIKKQKVLFKKLYEDKVINNSQYEKVSKNLKKQYLVAFLKNLFKKMRLKNLVYSIRRIRFRANQ